VRLWVTNPQHTLQADEGGTQKTSRLEEYEEILYTMRATVAGFPVLWWMSLHPFQRRVDASRHLRGSVVILFICF